MPNFDQSWFPTPPGVDAADLPPSPEIVVNSNPVPPNSVPVPIGFDEDNPDLDDLFNNILATTLPAVYPKQTTATQIIPPYHEVIEIHGKLRLGLRGNYYPYPLSVTKEEITGKVAISAENGEFRIFPGSTEIEFTIGGSPVVNNWMLVEVPASAEIEFTPGGSPTVNNWMVVEIPAPVEIEVLPGGTVQVSTTAEIAVAEVRAQVLVEEVLPVVITAQSRTQITVTETIPDPYFSSVQLLLLMDGANNSTTFIDDSNNHYTITPSGDAKISTAQSKWGGASAYFDGTNDYISTPVAAGFNFYRQKFTIECFVRPDQASSDLAGIFGTRITNVYTPFVVSQEGTGIHLLVGNASLNGYQSSVSSASSKLPAGSWTHIALVGTYNNDYNAYMKLYVGGVYLLFSEWPLWASANRQLFIGSTYPGGFIYPPGIYSGAYKGFVDGFRVTKGIARYTVDFTPPTEPFSAG